MALGLFRGAHTAVNAALEYGATNANPDRFEEDTAAPQQQRHPCVRVASAFLALLSAVLGDLFCASVTCARARLGTTLAGLTFADAPPDNVHHSVLAQAHVARNKPVGQPVGMHAEHPLGLL